MPQIIYNFNHSNDTVLFKSHGINRTLPLDFKLEKGNYKKISIFHAQLEFTIEILFRILNYHGYYRDKTEKTSTSGTHDVSHAIYASKTDYFFTTDKNFANRCKAVYYYLSVSTQVIYCKPDNITCELAHYSAK